MADAQLYTCLTCRLGFKAPEHQRQHYASDFHRYNAKRKVAELPPVSPEVFDTKVLERRAQQKAQEKHSEGPSRQFTCKPCGKTFGTKNAQDAHFASKKHREALSKGVADLINSTTSATSPAAAQAGSGIATSTSTSSSAPAPAPAPMDVDPPTATAHPPTSCLFCPLSSSSLETNLSHMLHAHGFFVPDANYLVDPAGLLAQLGEEIGVENMCIFCGQGFGRAVAAAEEGSVTGGKGVGEGVRRRRGLEAVRKHMVDKGHCKISWDTEEERLAFSDHYDFTSSYGPLPSSSSPGDDETYSDVASDDGDGEWEDDSDDADDLRPSNSVQYGSTPYELVLPSGARIGHRALRYVYRQNLLPYYSTSPSDPSSTETKIGRLAAAHQTRKERQSQALIPAKGAGFKPGEEGQVIRARNKGEAKRAMRNFVGERRHFEFETKRGFKGNNQKHYRDPLLQ